MPVASRAYSGFIMPGVEVTGLSLKRFAERMWSKKESESPTGTMPKSTKNGSTETERWKTE